MNWRIPLLALASVAAAHGQLLGPEPGKTVCPPLHGTAASNQAARLLELRHRPREIPSETRTIGHSNNPAGFLRYHLFKPAHFNPTNRYPLVLSLHGGGPRRSFDHLLEPFAPGFAYGIGRLVSPDEQARHPSFVLVPWSNGRGWDEDNLRLVLNALTRLRLEFKIDPRRIYVTGQSMGGYGTWEIVTKFPNIFAAAIPVCGGGDPSLVPRVKDVPIWALHGTADTVVPVNENRTMIEALTKAGGKPIYWEYDGLSHAETAERAYCEPQLLDWLFAQAKPAGERPHP